MRSSSLLRLSIAVAAACLVSSCASGPRYQATTGNTGTIYGKIVNPATWMTTKELHTTILSIDGVSAGSGRSVAVDAGKHSIELMGVGPGNFSVFGTLPLTVEKDQYYYFRCRREGSYRFTCEIEEDSGMKTVGSAGVRSRR